MEAHRVKSSMVLDLGARALSLWSWGYASSWHTDVVTL